MYEIAKKARAGMKSKAERLAGEKDRKTDSSDWSPAEPLNADVKTGMRPVSRRAYKSGGKVSGCAAPTRADRKPRKAGGRVETKGEQPLVDRYVNRDLKKANEYRDGTKHVGALKHGGRAKKADGGPTYGKDGVVPLPYKKTTSSRSYERPDYYEQEDKATGTVRMMPIPAIERRKDRFGKPIEGAYKNGGRAKKADGGYMSMEEMIKKNPAPVKKPLGLDKIPLPPRRPTNLTPAVPNEKYKKDTDLNTQSYKDGGRTGEKWIQKAIKKPGALHKQLGVAENKKIPAKKLESAAEKGGKLGKRARLAQTLRSMHSDGGEAIDKRLAEYKAFQERLKKEREDFSNEQERKYPGKSFWERVDADLKEKFSPAFFADLKAQRKKELAGNKDYQEFAARRAKKSDDNSDDKMKKGGRVAKADGGGMDPRLGIVSPKMLQFGANEVTPGLKRGGRAKREDGGVARAAGAAAVPSLAPVNVTTSAPNVPPVSSGLLPQPKGTYEKPPVYDPTKYGDTDNKAGKKGFGDFFGKVGNYAQPMAAKKGGRIAKQIGGALGMSANRAMPQLPPQAMANAQGRPFQPGGKFNPVTTMPVNPIGATPPMATTMPVDAAAAPMTSALPVMTNPGGQQLPAQAIANAQGQPFQPGGRFNPMARANGGRIARASGGSAKSKGKGKTNINIIIAAGKKEPQSMIPNVPQAPMGMPPMQKPNMPAAAPMGAPPIAQAPMLGGQPPMPGAFKQGGRVSKVARSFKDMTAGAGSGEGRLQKTDIAKRAPHKAGGKVYRSYKDMDAGSGSGKGRLEKTEIQSRKR